MPGPAPKKNARRRNPRPDWRRLPKAGRSGPPPPWPIGGRAPAKGVRDVWDGLWSSPQAVAWEELGWTRVVARYARLLVAAEKANATAALLAEVRQLEDRLGLTPMAMRRLQWEIDDSDEEEGAPSEGVVNLDDYRDLYGG